MAENINPHDDRIVTGKELEKSLGRSIIETIVYEPEDMFGITLQSRFSYRLSEIDDALKTAWGFWGRAHDGIYCEISEQETIPREIVFLLESYQP